MEQDKLFSILSEGNQNSLGRVLEVFDWIISGEISVAEIYSLYSFEDRIVSMRVSNLMKRLWRHDKTLILVLVDQFVLDAQKFVNPTFRWTLAQVFKELYSYLSDDQREKLLNEIKRNLTMSDDWITISQSLNALLIAHKKGHGIEDVLNIVIVLTSDSRKAVKAKALKVKGALEINEN